MNLVGRVHPNLMHTKNKCIKIIKAYSFSSGIFDKISYHFCYDSVHTKFR